MLLKRLLELSLHPGESELDDVGLQGDSSSRRLPLPQQDAALWARPLIVEAEALLTAAARVGRFDRFQCEAAIQPVHAHRRRRGSCGDAARIR
jgi:predicted RNA polymerase sigma factor